MLLSRVSFYILPHLQVPVKNFFLRFSEALELRLHRGGFSLRGLASPVCRWLFADDLYYITRFFRACQYVFAKKHAKRSENVIAALLFIASTKDK